MQMWPEGRRRGTLITAACATAALGLAACGSSSSSGTASSSGQVPASAKQTIVFAEAGLGAEGTATNAAIAGFEKLHPNIKVNTLNLSSNATVAEAQEEKYFIAGASSPDVVYTDVTWDSAFARSGWIANLSSYKPDTSAFFPGQVSSTEYNGSVYAMSWFPNAEGLYYNRSLVKTPPTSIAQLVADAKSAMAKDKSLKEGLAFEGANYEGAVTAWLSFGAQIGASHLSNIDTPANNAALTFEYDAIHKYKISPAAVTAWNEGNVQDAWLSGQTPFALNWPYIEQLSASKTNGKPAYPAVYGKTGWAPFPSPTPQATLGGDNLAINAKSTHKAAAWEFIQYLDSKGVQDARAIAAGDPPALLAAYNSTLYAAAPYYDQEKAVYAHLVSRPVTPEYAQISEQLQPMLSSVLSGQATPSAALSAAAPTIAQLVQTASS